MKIDFATTTKTKKKLKGCIYINDYINFFSGVKENAIQDYEYECALQG